MEGEYTDKQLEEFYSSIKWWKEDMKISEIETSKKLIQLLEAKSFQLDYSIRRKWFDDWREDGIKKALKNIEYNTDELKELIEKRKQKK